MSTPTEAAPAHLGWSPLHDVAELLEYHFMVNALLAGAAVAVTAGLVGWLMVLRREAFAGHTLSVMAFPGAGAAALVGIPAAWGYFAFSGLAALAIGLVGAGRADLGHRSAGIAAVQAAGLAAGFLFLSLYGGVLSDLENVLFGTFLGVSDERLLVLCAVAVAVLAALAALGRPLLFVSVDAEVAGARGLPARALSGGFLLLLAATVAAASQVTGVLLVFALLVGPPASAQALTARPAASLVLTVVLGLFVVWVGLALSYFSAYPAGFFIAATSFAVYALARALAAVRGARASEQTATRSPRGVIA